MPFVLPVTSPHHFFISLWTRFSWKDVSPVPSHAIFAFENYKASSSSLSYLFNQNWWNATQTIVKAAHIHPCSGPLFGTYWVSRYQKGKTNLDFTEARDSEWQWHQLGHMQICTSSQTDNHASTPPLRFLQARCPSCCPANRVKALKAIISYPRFWLYVAEGVCVEYL